MEKDVNADKSGVDQLNDQDPSPESDEIVETNDPEVDVETDIEEPEPKDVRVPKARLDEVIQQRDLAEERAAEAERQRLETDARLASLTEKAKPKLTRDSLRAAVEQGLISQAQAEDTWDEELVRRATEKSKAESRVEVATAAKVASVDAEIGRFRTLMPAVADKHSQERQVLEKAYADVVYRLGEPQTKAQQLSYELTALRETFGRIENLEKTRTAPKRPARFFNREVGGAGQEVPSKDPVANLNNVQKRYYAKMIEKRVYGGWDDVRKELSWKRGDKK